jgi:tetratricopeptide (TPR) repeat protein
MLGGAPGAYRLAQALASLQMPATVQAVLAARIDRLSPEEKHVLQTGAVIGTEVPWPLLQAIADLPEADLYRDLAHLQAAEFLYETRLFPERAFTFKHALTHEVAYNGLLQERRRLLHGRIVEHLAALSAERQAEQVERLAHHAVRGERWDQAVTYCQQAAARAMAGSAYREAVGYFEQALAALAQLPECRDTLEQAIDLRCDLRNALLPLDEHTRILDYFRTAETLAEQLDDDQRRGRIAGQLCLSLLAMEEYAHAMTAGQRALALALSSGALEILVPAQTALAMVYLHSGDFREAVDVAQQAVAALTGNRRYAHFGRIFLPGVSSRCYLAVCLAELGDITAGRGVGEDAVRLAEEVEHSYSIALALWYVGMFRLRQRDIQTAIVMLERGLALCQSTSIRLHIPLLTASLGAAYALAGRGVEARPLLDQTLEHVATGSRFLHHAHVLVELCEALLRVGRVEDTGDLASHLLTLSRTHTGRGYQAHAYRLLGEVTRHREPPDIDQATAHYRQSLVLAEELGLRPLQAHCHLGFGTLYARTGQRQQAQTELSAAIDFYRAMDMLFWLPQAEAALAQIEGVH